MAFAFPRGFDIEQTAASAFAKASFNDVAFPISNISVRGAIRVAQHEFPHSPGAEVEKMGRKPYVIGFTCPFHYLPGSELDKQYPELYPTKLRTLREFFEKELTGNLVIPTIGTIPAVATTWTQTFNAQVSSGEQVELEFIEDQDATKSFDDQTLDYGVTKMVEANDQLLAAAALAQSKQLISLTQAINDAVTAVQSVAGMADAMSAVVKGKIEAVKDLCAVADSTSDDLQHPANHGILEALKQVWLAAVKLADNITQTQKQLLIYTTPRLMAVNEIAMAKYGSSARSVEIMQLNNFVDALAIPPATAVVYAVP